MLPPLRLQLAFFLPRQHLFHPFIERRTVCIINPLRKPCPESVLRKRESVSHSQPPVRGACLAASAVAPMLRSQLVTAPQVAPAVAGRRATCRLAVRAAATSAPSNGSSAGQPTKKVLVVGGGWAGFGATKHLAEQGYDVTLLDASPNPGGLSGMSPGMLQACHACQGFPTSPCPLTRVILDPGLSTQGLLKPQLV